MSVEDRPDAASRSYPPAVSLLRRSTGFRDKLHAAKTGDVGDWLLGEAVNQDDLLLLFEEFICRLVATGKPLDRASLHVGTLHPQLYGFAWNWESGDGFCDEVKVPEEALLSDAYRKGPLSQVVEKGEMIRRFTSDPDAANEFKLVAELKAAGFTEYVAMPLRAGAQYHNAFTMATKQPGGFTADQFAVLSGYARLFALHVERHIALKLATNVSMTYLGKEAGKRVLEGSIKRGDGVPINAVIWVSDLRGFTDLSNRLDDALLTKLLNAYFERLVSAVTDHGGEVLKFIGDGLLAVFAYDRFDDQKSAAAASVKAAEQALAELDDLNQNAPSELEDSTLWKPLKTGIGLHEGEIFFGNIGGAARLDFTVIGNAVNAASRIEAMTKSLGRPLLLSQNVAQLLDRPLQSFGSQQLRGLAHPVVLYGI
ncbi:MAG: adenylate/guanylate cyclase domain-containing protein [Pseudomonadota bacterium]